MAKTFAQRVKQEGAAAPVRQGLGEMPLTLWVIVAGVILYLYIRRANLGIDTHPGEGRAVTVKPSVTLPGPPVLPPVTFEPPGHVPIIPLPGQGGGGVIFQ